MNPFRKLLATAYYRLEVRRQLYRVGDRRVFWPVLGKTLFNAVLSWNVLLPYRPRTILDVGAERGRTAREFVELFNPEFIGLVEPRPEMEPLLRKLDGNFSKKIFMCALGRQRGRAKMRILSSEASSTLLEPAEGLGRHYPGFDFSLKKTIDVEVRTLDDIFHDCEIESLDLLKIDVEGFELEVFSGGENALAKTRLVVSEMVFFEAHKNRPQFGDVYQFLHEAGFELCATFDWSLAGSGLPNYCNALFLNRRFFRARD
jgi:FkbM family methyltransferase